MDELYRANFLISLARKKYPLPVSYRGRLTEAELEKIREYCKINTPSVFMNGECMYSIRILKNQAREDE